VIDPLIVEFPNLATVRFKRTSPATLNYNCIAWAASRTDRWWWPNPYGYWPPGVTMAETVAAFEEAYGTLGYRRCADAAFAIRFEKIAVYVLPATGEPKHAARQLESGSWTSKLGEDVDIEHDTLDALNGQHYGEPALFMERPRAVARWPVACLMRLGVLLSDCLRRR